ncbi:MAG: hypothetical protein IPK63_09705 [Candidatus Competibacteraceae bacterium]|nr:hypothetical protein [Candidatus Competibacteraceae bacterium]
MNAPTTVTESGWFNWHFLAPRYWPVWLGLSLMKIMAIVAVSLATGHRPTNWLLDGSNRDGGGGSPRSTPGPLFSGVISRSERAALLEAHFDALGIGLFETALAWWGPDARLEGLGRVEGANLEQALARGKGVICSPGISPR